MYFLADSEIYERVKKNPEPEPVLTPQKPVPKGSESPTKTGSEQSGQKNPAGKVEPKKDEKIKLESGKDKGGKKKKDGCC